MTRPGARHQNVEPSNSLRVIVEGRTAGTFRVVSTLVSIGVILVKIPTNRKTDREVVVTDSTTRVDGSSDEAFVRSTNRMRAELKEEKRKAFDEARRQVMASEAPALDLVDRVRKRLDGMTVDEVIAEAANLDVSPLARAKWTACVIGSMAMTARKESGPDQMAILLTGNPGCGKTTLVHRIIEQLDDLRLAGFYTQELRGADCRRVGFQAIGLNGGSTTLASVKSKSKHRVGKYGVELSGFEQLLNNELNHEIGTVDLFVIDEVGKMECYSKRFIELVGSVLDGDTPVLATVAMRGAGFISKVKDRNDVELIEVDARNRDELVGQLAGRLRKLIAG